MSKVARSKNPVHDLMTDVLYAENIPLSTVKNSLNTYVIHMAVKYNVNATADSLPPPAM